MIENQIIEYLNKTQSAKAKFVQKLFTIFTETTGYRPEDICIVEEQVKTGHYEYKTLIYFDLKHRHRTAETSE